MKLHYLKPLPKLFEAHANADNAAYMKAYMKGHFEYYGLKTPLRRDVCKQFWNEYGLPDQSGLRAIVMELWKQPQREYQHFGMETAEKLLKKAPEKRLGLYEYMATHKSWWDTVDFIAAKLMGAHLQKYPHLIEPHTREWMDSGNMWLHRSALLFQLKYKGQTDEQRLYSYIEELVEEKEFFIRKAIGWTLREYGKSHPDSVKRFVASHTLSPLSEREALKNL